MAGERSALAAPAAFAPAPGEYTFTTGPDGEPIYTGGTPPPLGSAADVPLWPPQAAEAQDLSARAAAFRPPPREPVAPPVKAEPWRPRSPWEAAGDALKSDVELLSGGAEPPRPQMQRALSAGPAGSPLAAAAQAAPAALGQRAGGPPRPAGGALGGGPRGPSAERQLFDLGQREEAERAGIVQDSLALDAQTAGSIAQAKANALDVAENARREQEDLQRRYEDERAKQTAALEAAQRELDQTRIDPERWWNEGSTLGKIGAVIGAALGAAGSALTKTPNAALAIIEGKIARDMDAQRQNFEGKKAKVAGRKSLLDLNRAHFAEDSEAIAATQAMMWEQVAREADYYATAAIPKQKQLQAQELASMARQRSQSMVLMMQADAERRAAAAAAAARAPQQQVLQLKDEERARLVTIGGESFFAQTPEKAKEATARLEAAAKTRRIANELVALSSKITAEDIARAKLGSSSPNIATWEELSGQLVTHKAVAEGQGALGNEERTAAMKRMPSPFAVFDAEGSLQAALDAAVTSADGAARSYVSSSGGLVPVATGVGPDKRGNPQEQFAYTGGQQQGAPQVLGVRARPVAAKE